MKRTLKNSSTSMCSIGSNVVGAAASLPVFSSFPADELDDSSSSVPEAANCENGKLY